MAKENQEKWRNSYLTLGQFINQRRINDKSVALIDLIQDVYDLEEVDHETARFYAEKDLIQEFKSKDFDGSFDKNVRRVIPIQNQSELSDFIQNNSLLTNDAISELSQILPTPNGGKWQIVGINKCIQKTDTFEPAMDVILAKIHGKDKIEVKIFQISKSDPFSENIYIREDQNGELDNSTEPYSLYCVRHLDFCKNLGENESQDYDKNEILTILAGQNNVPSAFTSQNLALFLDELNIEVGEPNTYNKNDLKHLTTLIHRNHGFLPLELKSNSPILLTGGDRALTAKLLSEQIQSAFEQQYGRSVWKNLVVFGYDQLDESTFRIIWKTPANGKNFPHLILDSYLTFNSSQGFVLHFNFEKNKIPGLKQIDIKNETIESNQNSTLKPNFKLKNLQYLLNDRFENVSPIAQVQIEDERLIQKNIDEISLGTEKKNSLDLKTLKLLKSLKKIKIDIENIRQDGIESIIYTLNKAIKSSGWVLVGYSKHKDIIEAIKLGSLQIVAQTTLPNQINPNQFDAIARIKINFEISYNKSLNSQYHVECIADPNQIQVIAPKLEYTPVIEKIDTRDFSQTQLPSLFEQIRKSPDSKKISEINQLFIAESDQDNVPKTIDIAKFRKIKISGSGEFYKIFQSVVIPEKKTKTLKNELLNLSNENENLRGWVPLVIKSKKDGIGENSIVFGYLDSETKKLVTIKMLWETNTNDSIDVILHPNTKYEIFDAEAEIDQINQELENKLVNHDLVEIDPHIQIQSNDETNDENVDISTFKTPNFDVFTKAMMQTNYPIHVLSPYKILNNPILSQNLDSIIKLDRKLCFPSQSNTIGEIIEILNTQNPDQNQLATFLDTYFKQILGNQKVGIDALDVLYENNDQGKLKPFVKFALRFELNQSQTIYLNLNLGLGISENANYMCTRVISKPYLVTKQDNNTTDGLENYVSISNWDTLDDNAIKAILALEKPDFELVKTKEQTQEQQNTEYKKSSDSETEYDENHIDVLKSKLFFRDKSKPKDKNRKIAFNEKLSALTNQISDHIVTYGKESGWALNVALKLETATTQFNLFTAFINKILDNDLLNYSQKEFSEVSYALNQSSSTQNIAKIVNDNLPLDIDVVSASPKDLFDKHNSEYTMILQKTISDNSIVRLPILVNVRNGKIRISVTKKRVLDEDKILFKNAPQYQIISIKNDKNKNLDEELKLVPKNKKRRPRRSDAQLQTTDTPLDSRVTNIENISIPVQVELPEFFTSSSQYETVEKSQIIETYAIITALLVINYRNSEVYDEINSYLKLISPTFYTYLEPYLNGSKSLPADIESYIEELNSRNQQKLWSVADTLNQELIKPNLGILLDGKQFDLKVTLDNILLSLNQALPRTQLELYKTEFNKLKYVNEYEMIIKTLISQVESEASGLGRFLKTDVLDWGKTRNDQKVSIPNVTLINYLGLEVTYNKTKIPHLENIWRFILNKMLSEKILSQDDLKELVAKTIQKKKLLIIGELLINELEKNGSLLYKINKFTDNGNLEAETEKLLGLESWVENLPISQESAKLCIEKLKNNDFKLEIGTKQKTYTEMISDLKNENEKDRYDKNDLIKIKKQILKKLKEINEFESLLNLRKNIRSAQNLIELREINFEPVKTLLQDNPQILKQTEQIEPELIENEINEIGKVSSLSEEQESAHALMMAILTKREVDSIGRDPYKWHSSLTKSKLEKERLENSNKQIFRSVVGNVFSKLYSDQSSGNNFEQSGLDVELKSIFDINKELDPESVNLLNYFEDLVKKSIEEFISKPDLVQNLGSNTSVEDIRNSILAKTESEIAFLKTYNPDKNNTENVIKSLDQDFKELIESINFESFTIPQSLNQALSQTKDNVDNWILEAVTGYDEIDRFKDILDPNKNTEINEASPWESLLNRNCAKIEVLNNYIEIVNKFKKPWQIASNVSYIVSMFEGSVLFDIVKHGIFEIFCKNISDSKNDLEQNALEMSREYNSDKWTDKKAILDMLSYFKPQDYLDLCDLILDESSGHTLTTNTIEMIDGVPTITGTEEISASLDLSTTNNDKHEYIYPEIVQDPEKGEIIIYRKIVSHATRYIPITKTNDDGTITAHWILAATPRTDSIIGERDDGGTKAINAAHTISPYVKPLTRIYTKGENGTGEQKVRKSPKRNDPTRPYASGTNTTPDQRYQPKVGSVLDIDDETAVQRLVSPYFEKIDKLNHLGNALPKTFEEDDTNFSIKENELLLHLVDVFSESKNTQAFKGLSSKILNYLQAELKNHGTASIFEQNGIDRDVLTTYRSKLQELSTLEEDLSDNLEVTSKKTLSLIHNFLKLNALGLSLLTIPTHKHLLSLENTPGLSTLKSKLTQNEGDDRFKDTFDRVSQANELAKSINQVLYPETEIKLHPNNYLKIENIDELLAYFCDIYNGNNVTKASTEVDINEATDQQSENTSRSSDKSTMKKTESLDAEDINLEKAFEFLFGLISDPEFIKETIEICDNSTSEFRNLTVSKLKNFLSITRITPEFKSSLSPILTQVTILDILINHSIPNSKTPEETHWLNLFLLSHTIELLTNATRSKSNQQNGESLKNISLKGIPKVITQTFMLEDEGLEKKLEYLTSSLFGVLSLLDKNGDFQKNFSDNFREFGPKYIAQILRHSGVQTLESVADTSLIGFNISNISTNKTQVRPLEIEDVKPSSDVNDFVLHSQFISTKGENNYLVDIDPRTPDNFSTTLNSVYNGKYIIHLMSVFNLYSSKRLKPKESFINLGKNYQIGKQEILQLNEATQDLNVEDKLVFDDLSKFIEKLFYLKNYQFLFEQKEYPKSYNQSIVKLGNFELHLKGEKERKLLGKCTDKCLQERNFKKFGNIDINLVKTFLNLLSFESADNFTQYISNDFELTKSNVNNLLAAYYIYFDYIATRIELHINPKKEFEFESAINNPDQFEVENISQIPGLQGVVVDLLTNDEIFDKVKANHEKNIKNNQFLLQFLLENNIDSDFIAKANVFIGLGLPLRKDIIHPYNEADKLVQTDLFIFQSLGKIILDLIKTSENKKEINWLKTIFFAYNFEFTATLAQYEIIIENESKKLWEKYGSATIPRAMINTMYKNNNPLIDEEALFENYKRDNPELSQEELLKSYKIDKLGSVVTSLLGQSSRIFKIASELDPDKTFEEELRLVFQEKAPSLITNILSENAIISSETATIPELLGFKISGIDPNRQKQLNIERVTFSNEIERYCHTRDFISKGSDNINYDNLNGKKLTIINKLWEALKTTEFTSLIFNKESNKTPNLKNDFKLYIQELQKSKNIIFNIINEFSELRKESNGQKIFHLLSEFFNMYLWLNSGHLLTENKNFEFFNFDDRNGQKYNIYSFRDSIEGVILDKCIERCFKEVEFQPFKNLDVETIKRNLRAKIENADPVSYEFGTNDEDEMSQMLLALNYILMDFYALKAQLHLNPQMSAKFFGEINSDNENTETQEDAELKPAPVELSPETLKSIESIETKIEKVKFYKELISPDYTKLLQLLDILHFWNTELELPQGFNLQNSLLKKVSDLNILPESIDLGDNGAGYLIENEEKVNSFYDELLEFLPKNTDLGPYFGNTEKLQKSISIFNQLKNILLTGQSIDLIRLNLTQIQNTVFKLKDQHFPYNDLQILHKTFKIISQNNSNLNEFEIKAIEPSNDEFKNKEELFSYLNNYELSARKHLVSIILNLLELGKSAEFEINGVKIEEFNQQIKELERQIESLKSPSSSKVEEKKKTLSSKERRELEALKNGEKQRTLNFKASVVETFVLQKYLESVTQVQDADPDITWAQTYRRVFPSSPVVVDFNAVSSTIPQNHSLSDLEQIALQNYENSNRIHQEHSKKLSAIISLNLALNQSNSTFDDQIESLENTANNTDLSNEIEQIKTLHFEVFQNIKDSIITIKEIDIDNYNKSIAYLNELEKNINELYTKLPDSTDLSTEMKKSLILVYKDSKKTINDFIKVQLDKLPKTQFKLENVKAVEYEINKLDILRKFDILENLINTNLPSQISNKKDVKSFFEIMKLHITKLRSGLEENEFGEKTYIDKLWNESEKLGAIFTNNLDNFKPNVLNVFPEHNNEILEILKLELEQNSKGVNEKFNTEQITRYTIALGFARGLNFYMGQLEDFKSDDAQNNSTILFEKLRLDSQKPTPIADLIDYIFSQNSVDISNGNEKKAAQNTVESNGNISRYEMTRKLLSSMSMSDYTYDSLIKTYNVITAAIIKSNEQKTFTEQNKTENTDYLIRIAVSNALEKLEKTHDELEASWLNLFYTGFMMESIFKVIESGDPSLEFKNFIETNIKNYIALLYDTLSQLDTDGRFKNNLINTFRTCAKNSMRMSLVEAGVESSMDFYDSSTLGFELTGIDTGASKSKAPRSPIKMTTVDFVSKPDIGMPFTTSMVADQIYKPVQISGFNINSVSSMFYIYNIVNSCAVEADTNGDKSPKTPTEAFEYFKSSLMEVNQGLKFLADNIESLTENEQNQMENFANKMFNDQLDVIKANFGKLINRDNFFNKNSGEYDLLDFSLLDSRNMLLTVLDQALDKENPANGNFASVDRNKVKQVLYTRFMNDAELESARAKDSNFGVIESKDSKQNALTTLAVLHVLTQFQIVKANVYLHNEKDAELKRVQDNKLVEKRDILHYNENLEALTIETYLASQYSKFKSLKSPFLSDIYAKKLENLFPTSAFQEGFENPNLMQSKISERIRLLDVSKCFLSIQNKLKQDVESKFELLDDASDLNEVMDAMTEAASFQTTLLEYLRESLSTYKDFDYNAYRELMKDIVNIFKEENSYLNQGNQSVSELKELYSILGNRLTRQIQRELNSLPRVEYKNESIEYEMQKLDVGKKINELREYYSKYLVGEFDSGVKHQFEYMEYFNALLEPGFKTDKLSTDIIDDIKNLLDLTTGKPIFENPEFTKNNIEIFSHFFNGEALEIHNQTSHLDQDVETVVNNYSDEEQTKFVIASAYMNLLAYAQDNIANDQKAQQNLNDLINQIKKPVNTNELLEFSINQSKPQSKSAEKIKNEKIKPDLNALDQKYEYFKKIIDFLSDQQKMEFITQFIIPTSNAAIKEIFEKTNLESDKINMKGNARVINLFASSVEQLGDDKLRSALYLLNVLTHLNFVFVPFGLNDKHSPKKLLQAQSFLLNQLQSAINQYNWDYDTEHLEYDREVKIDGQEAITIISNIFNKLASINLRSDWLFRLNKANLTTKTKSYVDCIAQIQNYNNLGAMDKIVFENTYSKIQKTWTTFTRKLDSSAKQTKPLQNLPDVKDFQNINWADYKAELEGLNNLFVDYNIIERLDSDKVKIYNEINKSEVINQIIGTNFKRINNSETRKLVKFLKESLIAEDPIMFKTVNDWLINHRVEISSINKQTKLGKWIELRESLVNSFLVEYGENTDVIMGNKYRSDLNTILSGFDGSFRK